ncbi:MAG: hypothetical protein K2Q24_17420 [Chitinophagaceae bacterium]|nr:hypothetical protein [Chitinophagaceae bacterium]
MKLTTELLRDTAIYIQDYYKAQDAAKYCFHTYNRTMNIVRNCDALAVALNAGKQEAKLAHLACWFLETGYCTNDADPQQTSAALAKAFFTAKAVDEEKIEVIEECILSTREPRQPVSATAQLVCDAAMYHLADKEAMLLANALRAEHLAIAGKEYSDEEWILENIQTISNHFYFTVAAREAFQKRKEKTLSAYQNKLELLRAIVTEPDNPSFHQAPAERETVLHEEEIKLERGVESFFRITERRHMELSTKAHDKASLLISINSIVLSIVLSVLITKLEENKFLLLPTLFLVITCATTIILAIISTRPRLIDNDSKNKPLDDHEMNILFFGDFSKLSLNEYKKIMKTTYRDRNALYDSLSKDIYYQGLILVWKYKYINIAYNFFMYGFIITILTFIGAYAIHSL